MECSAVSRVSPKGAADAAILGWPMPHCVCLDALHCPAQQQWHNTSKLHGNMPGRTVRLQQGTLSRQQEQQRVGCPAII